MALILCAVSVVAALWGGGPVTFAPVATSSKVVLGGADYAQLVAASADRQASPGLATLLDSYRSWWSTAMEENGAEAATVDPDTVSVEIYDALAVYLGFSSRGLTVHTVHLLHRRDTWHPL